MKPADPDLHPPRRAASASPPGVAGVTAWTLHGASGTAYAFAVHRRSALFRAVGAVYVLGYLHPKGHVAGFVLHTLYAGQAADLGQALAAPPAGDCLRRECWNCVCALVTDADEDRRRAMVRDLLAAHPWPCNP